MCPCKMLSVFRREFKSYFDSPVAYVFLVAFLVLVGFLTFGLSGFYERGQAVLTPFFIWHPWVYLLLVPAATMGLWAEERRNGTIELLLTMPITLTEALVGKFLAAWAFIGVGLVLTFPILITTAYLGNPDWGAVTCGYVGSILLAGAATAIGVFASSLSRSQVIGFVVALAILFTLLIIGAGRNRRMGSSQLRGGRSRVVLAAEALHVPRTRRARLRRRRVLRRHDRIHARRSTGRNRLPQGVIRKGFGK